MLECVSINPTYSIPDIEVHIKKADERSRLVHNSFLFLNSKSQQTSLNDN